MKLRIQFTWLPVALIALGLHWYNRNVAYKMESVVPELDYSLLFLGVGLLGGIVFMFTRDTKILSKVLTIIFGLSLVINLFLLYDYYNMIKEGKEFEEYTAIKSCKEMEMRFQEDVKKGKIKYFEFGMGTIIGFKETLKNYDITSYGMGCILYSEMKCYNKLVEEYFEKTYDKPFRHIYQEVDSLYGFESIVEVN